MMPTMVNPMHVLCLAPRAPDLVTSGFGPFVMQDCASLDDVVTQMRLQPCDALWLDLAAVGGVERLAQWASLPTALVDATVVVVAPEPTWALCQRLLQLGVRDVVSAREAAGDGAGRLLRLAIERHRADSATRRAFGIDLATGLPNTTQLLEHMSHLLALREREPAAMALILIQVEGTQSLALSLGVEAGNVLRRKLAVRLRASLRASDVVASLGEGVYAVLLAWMDAEDDGRHVLAKLLTAISQPQQVAGQTVPLRARGALALYPTQGRDAQTLLRSAAAELGDDTMGNLMRRDSAANEAM